MQHNISSIWEGIDFFVLFISYARHIFYSVGYHLDLRLSRLLTHLMYCQRILEDSILKTLFNYFFLMTNICTYLFGIKSSIDTIEQKKNIVLERKKFQNLKFPVYLLIVWHTNYLKYKNVLNSRILSPEFFTNFLMSYHEFNVP